MAETTLQQHLEKAYALAYKAQRLVRVDRTAMRIYKELKEVIENLEFYLHNKIEYDEAEVGTKLRYYEKQLQLIEEKRDSSFRQVIPKIDGKLGKGEDE
jgi:response regulator RpfG family c-di-GMP phosphodiesterase